MKFTRKIYRNGAIAIPSQIRKLWGVYRRKFKISLAINKEEKCLEIKPLDAPNPLIIQVRRV